MELCRVCMKPPGNLESVQIFTPIGEVFIANIIVACAAIEILEDDGLPTGLCQSCFIDIKNIVAFVQKCRESDAKLRKMLKNENENYFLEIPKLPNVDVEIKNDEADEKKPIEIKIEEVVPELLQVDMKESDLSENENDDDNFQNNSDDYDDGFNTNSSDSDDETLLDLMKKNNDRLSIIPVKGHLCCGCFNMFKSSKQLEAHAKSEHVSKNFNPRNYRTCIICAVNYSSDEKLRDHMEVTLSLKNILECNECKDRFPNKQSFDKHCERKHSQHNLDEKLKEIDIKMKGIVCCGCLYVFKSREEMLQHAQQAHPPKEKKPPKKQPASRRALNRANCKSSIECAGCRRFYKNEDALQKHWDYVSSLYATVYECTECGKRFKYRHDGYGHVRNHSVLKEMEQRKNRKEKRCCAQGCFQMFQSEEELIDHAHTEHVLNKIRSEEVLSRLPFECDVCFRRCKSLEAVHKHKQRKYGSKSHQCTICGLAFRHASDVNKHELKHEGLRPYACDKCPKQFFSPSELALHKETHDKAKKFVCQHCGWAFLRKANLQKHVICIHDSTPMFKCTICSKGFTLKINLKNHLMTHKGERPHKCKHCEKTFTDPSNRRVHEWSHTGYKPHKCDLCTRSFLRKPELIKHLATH